MKLFLSSVSIADANQQAFLDLVGKDAQDISVALIENGADMYTSDHREWVDRARGMIQATVGKVVRFDLRDYSNAGVVKNDLSKFDVIWVGGGNAFYLRWLSRQSGFDVAIKDLIAKGIVYGGDSAGAIIAGPTIDNFQLADTPEDAPEVILDGFGLTDIVPIPHYGNQKYGHIMRAIEDKFKLSGYRAVPIADEQAIIINNDTMSVIGQEA